MSTLFNRKVKCIIGRAGEQGVSIEGLDIAFHVEKSARRHPNKAKIEIYNLDRTTAAAITDSKDRLKIQLFAGYEGMVSMIFQGEIRPGRARTEVTETDRITKIEASDGGDLYRESRVNKTLEGVSGKQILEELARSFGVSLRLPDEVLRIAVGKTFTSYTLSGRTSDVLDSLADSFGLVWFLEDGVLKVVPRNGDTGEIAVLLTYSTGLVDAPVKTSKGVSGTSLLNPNIRPRRVLDVRTDDVKGFFRVQSIEIKGSSGFSTPFYTIFEAVQAAEISEDKAALLKTQLKDLQDQKMAEAYYQTDAGKAALAKAQK